MAKHLSEIQQSSILALHESGFTQLEIAEKCGVNDRTVRRYISNLRNGDCEDLISQKSYVLIKKNIESRLAIQASKYLGALQTAKIPELVKIKDHKDAAITFGILHQHYRLASGLSTENQAVNVLAMALQNKDKAFKSYKKPKVDPGS